MRLMKIAIYQSEGKPKKIDDNLESLRRAAISAVEQGSRLLICPEMFLTGYNIGDAVFNLAEPLHGPVLQKAAAIARQTEIALLFGYPERNGADVYNSAILIDRKGEIRANYRKTHLYGSEEKRLFRPGDAFVVVELEGVNLGILICYDIEFPETVRALALAGAELIAVPTAIMEPYCLVARLVVPARAYENQIFTAYANRCGHEGDLTYCGLSCIVGPDGSDLVRCGTDAGLMVADIDRADITASREINHYLTDRRPELYKNPIMGRILGSDE
ncbi:MAG: carbon-nitrogen hydrolase family protein [Desulfobacterales bacterium]|nr:MAG: carbon-nitrogen hydrolase family protein [Desulfobacterales bacterium]